MKKLLTAVLFLTVVLSLVAYGQKTTWVFEKVFPDTGFQTSGVHGLAVSGAGLLWVQDYYGRAGDSVFQASTSTNRLTRAIYVYNTNGNVVPVMKIQIMSGTGIQDTLFSAGLGLRTGPDGDVYLSTVGTVYRVDGTTGAAKTKAVPFPGSSTLAVGVDDLNEVFVGTVVPGNPLKIYDATTSPAMTSLGNAIDTVANYGRSCNVDGTGNDVYNTRFGAPSFLVHSDNGSLGPYVVVDTLLPGMSIESSCWNKKDGLLYLSSGGQVGSTGYTNCAFFGYDPVTKTIKDSILWNLSVNSTADIRPRALAFSVTGDTAWACSFGTSDKYMIEMFRRVLVSVEKIESGIPSGYTLSQNYPNPFNPTTEIQFTVARAGFTTLKVYDMLGKEVATLVNENLNPGTFKSTLDGAKLSSGTYLYRLVSGSTAITKKMMLLK